VLRESQIFVTGHSVHFVTVKIYTLVSGFQAHTIQIVRAHARDLTTAAAGHAYGIARAANTMVQIRTVKRGSAHVC